VTVQRASVGLALTVALVLGVYPGGPLTTSAAGYRKAPRKRNPGLLRFDGRRWHIEQPPYEGKPDRPLLLDASGDGTFWLRRVSRVAPGTRKQSPPRAGGPGRRVRLRV
jgi:hypothetical protein